MQAFRDRNKRRRSCGVSDASYRFSDDEQAIEMKPKINRVCNQPTPDSIMHRIRNTPSMEATAKYNNFLQKKRVVLNEKPKPIKVKAPFTSLDRVEQVTPIN